MEERALKNLPLGTTGHISRCLSPLKSDVYRLLEMGLCRGAQFTVLCKASVLGAMEISLNGSRICIGDELADQFMAVVKINSSSL